MDVLKEANQLKFPTQIYKFHNETLTAEHDNNATSSFIEYKLIESDTLMTSNLEDLARPGDLVTSASAIIQCVSPIKNKVDDIMPC